MSRLKSALVMGTLAAFGWGTLAAGDEGPPAAATGASTPAAAPIPAGTRPEPPVPPLQYLETGAKLFNKGTYDLAEKYLGAAKLYRDRLKANEQVVLDVYLQQLEEYHHLKSTGGTLPARGTSASAAGASMAARVDPEVGRASFSTATAAGRDPKAPSMAPGAVRGSQTWRGTADPKQKARWLLQLAREQIFKGKLDEGEQSIKEAEALGIKWGFFDDTPDKVRDTLAKARVKKAQEPEKGAQANASEPHDRRNARVKLRRARAAIASGELREAELIVGDVQSWGLTFGILDDTPGKVARDLEKAKARLVETGGGLQFRGVTGVTSGLGPESAVPPGTAAGSTPPTDPNIP